MLSQKIMNADGTVNVQAYFAIEPSSKRIEILKELQSTGQELAFQTLRAAVIQEAARQEYEQQQALIGISNAYSKINQLDHQIADVDNAITNLEKETRQKAMRMIQDYSSSPHQQQSDVKKSCCTIL